MFLKLTDSRGWTTIKEVSEVVRIGWETDVLDGSDRLHSLSFANEDGTEGAHIPKWFVPDLRPERIEKYNPDEVNVQGELAGPTSPLEDGPVLAISVTGPEDRVRWAEASVRLHAFTGCPVELITDRSEPPENSPILGFAPAGGGLSGGGPMFFVQFTEPGESPKIVGFYPVSAYVLSDTGKTIENLLV